MIHLARQLLASVSILKARSGDLPIGFLQKLVRHKLVQERPSNRFCKLS